jgi:hypothetical protein
MDYKVIIADEGVEEELALEVFKKLQELVIKQKNIDMKNPAGFIVQGQEAVLIGTTWGVSRPDMEDIEEISSLFPELTFQVIQASRILNGNHFEDLRNYSLSVYQKGNLMEVYKPQPIVWTSMHQVQYLETPWES